MYSDSYSEEILKKLKKIKKRDPVEYSQIMKKIDEILANPFHKYKFLTFDMKSFNRVHLGHFVLVFLINHENQIIYSEDYDHHDNVYE